MAKPLVLHGEYNGIPITIYGEIHNQIDQSFFEELNVGEDTVWVEHSTQLCELMPGQEILFQEAKGLEWIWFTRTLEGKQVRCIDDRIKMGLMSRVEELRLKDQIDHIENDDMMMVAVEALVAQFQNVLNVIKETKNWKEHRTDVNPIKTRMFDRYEDMINHLPKVMDQSIPFEEMYEKCMNIYHDLCVMSSMLLDIVLIQQLKETTDKTPIHLFVGLAHAVRLQHWLQLDVVEPVDPQLVENIAKIESSLSGGRKRRKTKRKGINHLKRSRS